MQSSITILTEIKWLWLANVLVRQDNQLPVIKEQINRVVTKMLIVKFQGDSENNLINH